MNWIVTISALPERSESIKVDAKSSIEALREVLAREMVASAMERRPGASLCISVMKPVGTMRDAGCGMRDETNGTQGTERATMEGLALR